MQKPNSEQLFGEGIARRISLKRYSCLLFRLRCRPRDVKASLFSSLFKTSSASFCDGGHGEGNSSQDEKTFLASRSLNSRHFLHNFLVAWRKLMAGTVGWLCLISFMLQPLRGIIIWNQCSSLSGEHEWRYISLLIFLCSRIYSFGAWTLPWRITE